MIKIVKIYNCFFDESCQKLKDSTELGKHFSIEDFIFFYFTQEERKQIRISFIEYLGRSKEIFNIIFNLKKDGRLEEINDFLIKSEITNQLDLIIKEKRERVLEIKQEYTKTNDTAVLIKLKREYEDIRHRFNYCLEIKI
tara:strand:+ start:911 stop:1330 length:420 start_codon:yes stop_codon:yes gene_type:complete